MPPWPWEYRKAYRREDTKKEKLARQIKDRTGNATATVCFSVAAENKRRREMITKRGEGNDEMYTRPSVELRGTVRQDRGERIGGGGGGGGKRRDPSSRRNPSCPRSEVYRVNDLSGERSEKASPKRLRPIPTRG